MKFMLQAGTEKGTRGQLWDQFRIFRNQILAMTDWTQVPDNNLPAEKANEYKVFRQFLRDAPSMVESVLDLEIPYELEIIGYKMELKKETYKPQFPPKYEVAEIRSSKQRARLKK